MPLVAAESVVRAWLAQEFPDARVVTEVPGNLTDVLPCIEVSRFGGSDSLLVLDDANIDVDVYAAIGTNETRKPARILAEEVRTSLRLIAPGTTIAGGFIADVTSISAPTWTPYDNTLLRRFTASYRISIRSIP